ncbi:MAG: TraR/DksA C4-type zinc finger protein [Candidatus Paceibacterota bacterium]|jgi:RNA polymerase-binding protein DksA
MNKKDLERFKKKLITEKGQLEVELGEVGQNHSAKDQGWEATSSKIEVDAADENEVADKLEEYEENSGILKRLKEQLNEVDAALDRVEKGTYGTCETCGQPIEIERLEANPSSRISIKHAH